MLLGQLGVRVVDRAAQECRQRQVRPARRVLLLDLFLLSLKGLDLRRVTLLHQRGLLVVARAHRVESLLREFLRSRELRLVVATQLLEGGGVVSERARQLHLPLRLDAVKRRAEPYSHQLLPPPSLGTELFDALEECRLLLLRVRSEGLDRLLV